MPQTTWGMYTCNFTNSHTYLSQLASITAQNVRIVHIFQKIDKYSVDKDVGDTYAIQGALDGII